MKKRISEISFQEGFDHMSNSSVAICGIARDCSSELSKLIPKLESLGNTFKSYKVIVIENDSKDDTPDLIRAWAVNNPNVIPVLFCENTIFRTQQHAEFYDSRDFNGSRISRIAFARNQYLAERQGLQGTDYVLVVDLDIMDFSISGIANSFAQRNHWDCVTSAGYRYTLRSPFRKAVYWDTYAYEPLGGYPDGIQHLADIRHAQINVLEKLRSNQLISACSAFGGLAIYRSQFLAGKQYKATENDDPEVPFLCEHVYLHRSILQLNQGFRLVINPLQTLAYESTRTTITRSVKQLFAT